MDPVAVILYLADMSISGMIVVGIGSAIGTTIAMTRNPELFDPEQRNREGRALHSRSD